MMTAELTADTRMMGIVHAAFRRDLARVRLVLTAMPVPQGGRRRAVADQVLWLMQALHAHHHAEDSGLWPLVRQRHPAAEQLLDAMEADHRPIVPAMQALTAAARQYRSTDNDDLRLELVRALDWLTGVLEPHLDREVRDAMPVPPPGTWAPGTRRTTSSRSRPGSSGWTGNGCSTRSPRRDTR